MRAFTIVRGIAAAIPDANIDTDTIMPKQFLKGIDRSGLAGGAFFNLRFNSDGTPNETFVLNQDPWHQASFLVVGPNFGCGSSREHAVWGLQQLGIRAILGTTFAGIFFDNCANSGVLALSLEDDEIKSLMLSAQSCTESMIEIDLVHQKIATARDTIEFRVESHRRDRLLRGLDQVGVTLQSRSAIKSFEEGYFAERRWLQADP